MVGFEKVINSLLRKMEARKGHQVEVAGERRNRFWRKEI